MKYIVSMIAVATIFAQTANCQSTDCSWSDADCVADDLDDVAEGSFAQPLVKPLTEELREYGDGDPNTPDELSDDTSSSSDDDSYESAPQ